MESRISILAALLAAFSFSASASTNQSRLVESFGKIPLAFTLNQGQTDSQVKFTVRGAGCSMYFTPQGTTFLLSRAADSSCAKKLAYGSDRADTQVRPYESFAVNLSFLGANPSPEIVGEDALPGKSNYFIGNDPAKWRTGVSNYSKVRLKNLFDGVDLVYYGNQQKVKYDFAVSPGWKTHSDFCLRMIQLTVQSYFVITRSRI